MWRASCEANSTSQYLRFLRLLSLLSGRLLWLCQFVSCPVPLLSGGLSFLQIPLRAEEVLDFLGTLLERSWPWCRLRGAMSIVAV
jgi:hypothetical protein